MKIFSYLLVVLGLFCGTNAAVADATFRDLAVKQHVSEIKGMAQPDVRSVLLESERQGTSVKVLLAESKSSLLGNGDEQRQRSTYCSSGCSSGCSTGCSTGCSYGCSYGCSSGCR
jgi:hypothetical protein